MKILSEDDMAALESAIRKSERDDGRTRRVALAMLAQSDATLSQLIATDFEFADAAVESEFAIADYANRLRGLAGLMDVAVGRLQAARAVDPDASLH